MEQFKEELSKSISALINFPLGADHIHHDDPGYYYYIRKLEAEHPLLIMHYRGPLVLLLPVSDYCRLENGDISANAYIDQSYFSFGYYWGGWDMLGGGYWQPLQEGPGIKSETRITRYLHILSCRTETISSLYKPSEERCEKCGIDPTGCPYSPLNLTGCLDDEIHEPDGRRELFAAVCTRIKAELGFEASSRWAHDGPANLVYISPCHDPNTVSVSLSQDLLNGLLYRPDEKRNLAKLVQEFSLALTHPKNSKWHVILANETEDKHGLCLDFWQSHIAKYWVEKEEPEEEIEYVAENFCIRLRNALAKKFGRAYA